MSDKINNWDVFISHASEDKYFADKLASSLREIGLNVWYDSYVLEIGDSLTQKINEGLSLSNYGIVILSRNFLSKDWTKLEVSALLNREIRNQKVILPIWHEITFDEMIKLAPLLVDKLALDTGKDSMEKMAQNIFKVVRPNESKNIGNTILEVDFTNNTDLVILPFRPFKNLCVAIGKYPVTNSQYDRYTQDITKETRIETQFLIRSIFRANSNREISFSSPIGKYLKNGKWLESFNPWEDVKFNNPSQPVVCISAYEALAYTMWLNSITNKSIGRSFLIKPNIWNYAALGSFFSTENPSSWLKQTKAVHHKSEAPTSVYNGGERINTKGVSDMFGNVWEWCEPYPPDDSRIGSIMPPPRVDEVRAELKGGGFLDDLENVTPFLSSSMLEDDLNTKHFDLGFRICTLLNIENINSKTKEKIWRYDEDCKDIISQYYNSDYNGGIYDLYDLSGFIPNF